MNERRLELDREKRKVIDWFTMEGEIEATEYALSWAWNVETGWMDKKGKANDYFEISCKEDDGIKAPLHHTTSHAPGFSCSSYRPPYISNGSYQVSINNKKYGEKRLKDIIEKTYDPELYQNCKCSFIISIRTF